MTVNVSEREQADMPVLSAAIPPSKFAHVVIYTPQYQKSVEWYKFFFGMKANLEDDSAAFLTYDDEHHRIALVNVPNLKKPDIANAGFHHVAYTYSSLMDLLLTYERLAAKNVLPYWSINHGMTISLYYQDPDGNRLELQVDAFPTQAEGVDYCRSPAFAENPLGVEVEPADLLRRLRAGESEQDLKRRPDIGKRPLSAGVPQGV